ncbi:MAG: hypothetical protein K1X94_29735 [Sandaracinaceae bacterium]|nr:hypothetical protein [Sandaracinaceae bacterium]
MRALALWVFALVLGFLDAAPTASAQELDHDVLVTLRAELPAACGQAAALTERVERMLGHAVFVEGGDARPHLGATVEVHAEAGGWAATITLEDATSVLGRRTLRGEGRSCEGTTHAIALVLALMLDLSGREASLVVPEPEIAHETGRSDAIDAPPAPPGPRDRWALDALLSGGVSLGYLPGLAGSARARLGLSLRGVTSFVVSAGLVPGDAFVTEGAGVHLGVLSIALAACPVLAHDRVLALEGCVGVEGGELAVSGVGLRVVREASVGVLAPVAELRGTWWLADTIGLSLSTELGVPLVAHRFTATLSGEERLLVAMEPIWGRIELALRLTADLGSPSEPGDPRAREKAVAPAP